MLTKNNLNRIKVVLVEKHRTSKWLATQLGKGETTISKWCTNTTQPSLENLFKIACCLNVEITELINKRPSDTVKKGD